MSTQIPLRSRNIVKNRFGMSCTRCGVKAPDGHWHHRRSRRVRDQHQHCPCNGVWLCTTCHGWVHANPFEARGTGFIVSMHKDTPGAETTVTYLGPLTFECGGLFTFVK